MLKNILSTEMSRTWEVTARRFTLIITRRFGWGLRILLSVTPCSQPRNDLFFNLARGIWLPLTALDREDASTVCADVLFFF